MRALLKIALLCWAPWVWSAEHALRVTATAYNSTHAQTDAHPNKGAWGDTLEPGMKVIAVSPDLVSKGLQRGTQVTIEGIQGVWTVLDRTPSRLRNHIDLYMGENVRKARRFGRRKVTITWVDEAVGAEETIKE